MLIHFFGATRTTTGSMFLLELNGERLLFECGLFQGKRGESIERNRHFPFDPKQLDAVVLSHAHIDHCGNLPNLCQQGFLGNIYCTFATRDLAAIMLEDSAEIQRADAEYVSKKRARTGLPPVEPLYTAADAEQAVRQFVYTLHQLACEGTLPKVPIFVDSPLSVNATEVYRLHPECFNESTCRFLREKENPFGMENLTYIRELAHSMKLNDLKEPAIIISASGMCEAGRIRHHLKNHIGQVENLVLFIGYCAEHTLGAQILYGQKPVNIFGEPHPVRARVASLDAFSGHADKHELRHYVDGLTGDLKKIFVVHGEESQAMAFAESLRAMKPKAQVFVPEYKQSVSV